MASTDQVRGVLLEEVALWLLQRGGYRPVFSSVGDPTLCNMSGGLGIKGRGTKHQVDAIGDFAFGPPYGHPIRLLVEGKAPRRGRSIGVRVIREAIGVVQDVSQYWTGKADSPRRARYHYQSAIFSTVQFSRPSQELAFAHDIFLFPVGGIPHLRPLMDALGEAVERFKEELPGRGGGPGVVPSSLRADMRRRLSWLDELPGGGFELPAEPYTQLDDLIASLKELQGALLGMAGGVFPLFLVPDPGVDLDELPDELTVQIGIEEGAWFLRDAHTMDSLFSFDLPRDLAQMHAEDGRLGREDAVMIKGTYLNEIHAFYRSRRKFQVIRFRMDDVWYEELLRNAQIE